MENLEKGLLLMIVGMTTVFAILLIVIYLGKALIYLVNRYAPEEVVVKKQFATTKPAAAANSISNQTTAAIVSAVSVLTGGQGRVSKIEKL